MKNWIALVLILGLFASCALLSRRQLDKSARAPAAPNDVQRGPAPPLPFAPPRPQEATLAYDAPRTLPLGKIGAVALKIHATLNGEGLRVLVSAAAGNDDSSNQSVDITISPSMSATLTGAGFEITGPSPAAVQSTGPEGTASWLWQVKARETGPQKLILALCRMDTVDGHPTPHPVFERTLTVQVAP